VYTTSVTTIIMVSAFWCGAQCEFYTWNRGRRHTKEADTVAPYKVPTWNGELYFQPPEIIAVVGELARERNRELPVPRWLATR
jgi:hypothetical protein